MTSSRTGFAQQKGFDCLTDRDVYVSGETLLTKVFISGETVSKIVHIDLINRQGQRITGASMEINGGQADGFIHLPDSLSTGTYILRAYQKNPASGLKTLRELWIANRFDGLKETTGISRLALKEKIQDNPTKLIRLNGLKENYQTNEPISASVNIDGQLQKNIDGELLVGMAQTYPSFESQSFVWKSEPAAGDFIEDKGVILSGTVTDRNTKKPVAGVTVYLTVPDSIPGFQYYKTRGDGRFYFLLDKYYGPVQAFVQCFRINPAQPLKITLEDHLATTSGLPPFEEQPLSEEFKENINTAIDVITIRKIFNQDDDVVQGKPVRKQDSYPYYGMPTSTVDPQLFIDLPNFNEISKELLHGVKFRNYNNEPSLQVMYPAMRRYFEGMPLLLIDGIPVRDLNLVKDMGSNDIDRIDICESERFYGDLRFEGVVAIHTFSKDFSRIPESEQTIRLNLETIQVKVNLAQPTESAPNIPDLRQVFYWNPSVDPMQPLTINTKTSAVKGHFKLIVRGKLKDGSFIFAEKPFDVN
jgi:hypothetical protein